MGVKILVSGAGGFVGSALVPALWEKGHDVWALSRRPGERQLLWDPAAGTLDPNALEGFNAVIHLAGENVAGRWTQSKMEAIRNSRVQGTRLLAEAIARAASPPEVFVQASAVGYYGSRGDEVLTEESAAGEGFLADVCRDWETASERAEQLPKVRVVKLRFGVILSKEGGALAKMLPAFRLGLGGPIGSGQQWMAWISRRDAVALICRAATDSTMRGIYNGVSPSPVRNADFAHELGRALHRPALLRVPAPVLRILFRGMADEALLSSQRVVPAKLEREGFHFEDPDLGSTLGKLRE